MYKVFVVVLRVNHCSDYIIVAISSIIIYSGLHVTDNVNVCSAYHRTLWGSAPQISIWYRCHSFTPRWHSELGRPGALIVLPKYRPIHPYPAGPCMSHTAKSVNDAPPMPATDQLHYRCIFCQPHCRRHGDHRAHRQCVAVWTHRGSWGRVKRWDQCAQKT